MKIFCVLCHLLPCFGTAQHSSVRAAAGVAKIMAVGSTKNQLCGSQHLPAAALQSSSGGAKNTHFKPPPAHICRHALENLQNRAVE